MKRFKFEIRLILSLIILGQIAFLVYSPRYTEPAYEGNIYATTAVGHRNEDLHKLNEAAHYFGQTMIGWLKFPSFNERISDFADLPDSASVSAHIQERQNIIFNVSASQPIEQESLIQVKDFIQAKIDAYNDVSQTQFRLSNLDYERFRKESPYWQGAVIALALSLFVSACIIFIRREFTSS
jgi:hypothetical protein